GTPRHITENPLLLAQRRVTPHGHALFANSAVLGIENLFIGAVRKLHRSGLIAFAGTFHPLPSQGIQLGVRADVLSPTSPTCVYVDRITRRDRHHCRSDWASPACGAEGARRGGAHEVPEQPQANWSGVAQLPRRQREVPRWLAHRHLVGLAGLDTAVH